VIPNIWDLSSLNTVLSLNTPSSPSSPNHAPVKAIATASFAIAASLGLTDDQLSLGANLIRISSLAPHVRKAGLPLTVDIQDAYGEKLEDVVAAVVRTGAVGANVEDLRGDVDESGKGEEGSTSLLWSLEEQVTRIRRVLEVAAENGCPDFVVNARCDVMTPASHPSQFHSEVDDTALLNETIRRGKAYLSAGATTVFVWGGPSRGLRDHEIRTLVQEFGGRLAVKLGSGKDVLSVKQLAEMGVARISVGPELYRAALRAVREAAEGIVNGGNL